MDFPPPGLRRDQEAAVRLGQHRVIRVTVGMVGRCDAEAVGHFWPRDRARFTGGRTSLLPFGYRLGRKLTVGTIGQK